MKATFEERLKEAVKPWLGTPFRSLHCVKNVGVDCANIVVAVLADSGEDIPDVGAPTFGFSPSHRYRRMLDTFIQTLVEDGTLQEVYDDIQAGDVLLFKYDKVTQHLTLALDSQTMVNVHHKSSVTEVAIDDGWMEKLIGHYRLTTRM